MRPHRRSARPTLRARHGRRLAAAGMTLVELLVALLVGSFVAIAVVGVLAVAESGKRQTLAGSDMGQVGAYAMTQLDRMLRSAGSGYARSASYLFGCRLHAARGGTQILPLPSGSTLPAPFASVTTGSSGVFRLAPAVIAAGQTTPSAAGGRTSDVLLVMSGQSGQGEVALPFSTDAQAAALQLGSTVGLSAGEVLLIGDQQPASTGTAPCLITQVSSSFDASSGSGNKAPAHGQANPARPSCQADHHALIGGLPSVRGSACAPGRAPRRIRPRPVAGESRRRAAPARRRR